MSATIHVARELCDHHGQCTYAAPQLFWFGDDGELAHVPSLADDQVGHAREAAAACPVRAIKIEA